jgi:alcohol dehydrogenase
MDIVIARELEIVGSHGLTAHDYPAMLGFLESRQIDPGLLVEQQLTLEQLPEALAAMKVYSTTGVAVVTRF